MTSARVTGVAVAIGVLTLAACRRNEPAGAPGTEAAAPASSAAGHVAPVLTGPVTIQGTVVDARTTQPVAHAVVIVLNPGVSSQEWVEARGPEATQELMAGVAVTDASGRYEIPDLERGRTYTVMVTAEGYPPAIFENGLEVSGTDPEITSMQPVEL